MTTSLAADSEYSDLKTLRAQNQRLEELVRAQQVTIDALSAKMNAVLGASERHERELRQLQDRAPGSDAPAPSADGNRAQTVRISGEAGLAFFRTGKAGQFPNCEFRVDDAKLFFETPVFRDVYLFAGLDLTTREVNDEFLHVGELYADFENFSALWGHDRAMTLRVGRFNIPFGTEYLRRGVVENPLISHSLADLWGIDEGIEVYGSVAGLSYVLAVQNGGRKTLRDFTSDKAMVARLSYTPLPWLDTAVSAMRTGDVTVTGDSLTELWFGNGFFRALGNPTTTQTFGARLLEADATARWKSGHVRATAGWVRFDDNDRTADNSRRMHYATLEGVQSVTEDFYAALRFSEIHVPKGYPLVGWGDFGTYFYRSALTERLKRLSMGFGYRFGNPLVIKFEYTLESGRLTNGASRNHEDLLSTEVAMKF